MRGGHRWVVSRAVPPLALPRTWGLRRAAESNGPSQRPRGPWAGWARSGDAEARGTGNLGGAGSWSLSCPLITRHKTGRKLDAGSAPAAWLVRLPRVTRPLARGCSGWRWVRARFHPSVNQQPRALGGETTDGVCPDGADPGHPPHPQAAPSAATRCHGELGAASLCPSLLHTWCASGDHHLPPWGALPPPGSPQACRKPPSVEAQFRWAPSADTGACQGGALGPSAAWPTPNPSHLPVHGEVPACHKHTHHEATA